MTTEAKTTTPRMYIVLRFENDYNQHGSYFVSVNKCLESCTSPNGHFGRMKYENTWYEVRPFEFGEIFLNDAGQ